MRPLANGKTQAPSPLLSVGRMAQLRELSENSLQTLRRNAHAGVGDPDHHFLAGRQGATHGHASGVGEFDGVGYQVTQEATERHLVGVKTHRHLAGREVQAQTLRASHGLEAGGLLRKKSSSRNRSRGP
jgi:hypothetical protein